MASKWVTPAGVARLVDMGIATYQARAALKAAKGDIAEAAEKVFSGQFDDLVEGTEEEEVPVAGPSGTKHEEPISVDSDSETGKDDYQMETSSHDNGASGDDDHFSFDGDSAEGGGDFNEDNDMYDDDLDWDHQADPGEGNIANDPYAGIEYKKDRVEETIEVEMGVEKGKMWVQPLELMHPAKGEVDEDQGGGRQKKSSMDKPAGQVKPKAVQRDYEVLPQSAWMSGCPERGEQAILFQVYHGLTEGTLTCYACPTQWNRKPSDFFAYFPSSGSEMDFESYKAHLASVMIKTCPNGHHTCFACGEKCAVDGGTVSDWWDEKNGLHVGAAGIDEGKVKEGANKDDDAEEAGVEATNDNNGGEVAPITPAPTITDDFDEEEGGRPAVDKGKQKAKEVTIDEKDVKRTISPPSLFHCSDIQGVIVGVGLIMAQKAYEMSNETKHVEVTKAAVLAKRARGSSEEDMYGSGGPARAGFAKGTGYSGSAIEDRSGVTAAMARRLAADHELAVLLHSLGEFLPRPDRRGGCKPSDFAVDSSTIMHLRRRFNAVACTLFTSNSIMDMSDRSELHLELVDWLLTIAHTEALASLIAMPFMRAVKTERKATDAHGNTEISVRYEATDSPREVLERVAIQCRHVLKGAAGTSYDKDKQPPKKKSKGSTGEEAGKKASGEGTLVEFCNKIATSLTKLDAALLQVKGAAFFKRMQDTLPRQSGNTAIADAPKAGDSMEKIKAVYEAWAADAKFDYCDMRSPNDLQSFDHIFSNELVAMEGATSSKRSITIAKELAVLSQHLPVAWGSTVFLRVDESRTDCMKILMIGPEDSPYCNGAFAFDLACPSDYPARPPLCKIKSTSGGRMRFGPNLYAEGKVCLSLLGTWSGPGWISGTSTILQVVLSILSLILGQENPIANEPGHESQIGSEMSRRYNCNVRRMTVRVTMKEAIEDPFPPFKSVIHTHFKLKAREIRQQLDKWQKADDGLQLTGDSMSCRTPRSGAQSASALFKADLTAVRGYLDDLEAGREIVKKTTGSASGASGAAAPTTAPAGQ